MHFCDLKIAHSGRNIVVSIKIRIQDSCVLTYTTPSYLLLKEFKNI